MKMLSAVASSVIAALALSGAALAQDGPIWVQCEFAPGNSHNIDVPLISGISQISDGSFRQYDPDTQELSDDRCEHDAVTVCRLTADEFTFEQSWPTLEQEARVRIDRRTGRGSSSWTFLHPTYRSSSATVAYVCRGANDPRPAAQF